MRALYIALKRVSCVLDKKLDNFMVFLGVYKLQYGEHYECSNLQEQKCASDIAITIAVGNRI